MSKVILAKNNIGMGVPPAGPKLGIREEVAALKRQRILEVAAKLFFEQGFAATSVDMLAGSMEVTKPFIYTYFKNKAEILTAVAEVGIDESLSALAKGKAEAKRALEQLRITMEAGARSAIRFQTYVVVYHRELKSLEPTDAERILGKRSEFDRQLAALLKRGNAEGDMQVDNPAMTAAWVGGLLSWIPIWYAPRSYGQDKVIADFVTTIDRIVGASDL